jgi:hypothetical protein
MSHVIFGIEGRENYRLVKLHVPGGVITPRVLADEVRRVESFLRKPGPPYLLIHMNHLLWGPGWPHWVGLMIICAALNPKITAAVGNRWSTEFEGEEAYVVVHAPPDIPFQRWDLVTLRGEVYPLRKQQLWGG